MRKNTKIIKMRLKKLKFNFFFFKPMFKLNNIKNRKGKRKTKMITINLKKEKLQKKKKKKI
jgi:hypothetical protein